MNNKDKLLQQAADAKLVHLNENTIFPLLQSRIDQQIADMCNRMKKDGSVTVADVAYISACRDLMVELSSIAKNGDRAAVKLNLYPDIEGQD